MVYMSKNVIQLLQGNVNIQLKYIIEEHFGWMGAQMNTFHDSYFYSMPSYDFLVYRKPTMLPISLSRRTVF